MPNICGVQVARGSAIENYNYCTKGDGRVEGPWELGECPFNKEGGKKLLKQACDWVRAGLAIETMPQEMDTVRIMHSKGLRQFKQDLDRAKRPRYRKLDVLVLWGKTGLGKTRFAYENYDLDQIYKLTEPEGKLWWDGYNGQEVLLIDDFSGWIKYRFLLNVLDVYPLDLEVKGGFVSANYTKVIITSNFHPSRWYPRHGLDPPLERRLTRIQEVTENLFPQEGEEEEQELARGEGEGDTQPDGGFQLDGTPWELPSPPPFFDPDYDCPASPPGQNGMFTYHSLSTNFP